MRLVCTALVAAVIVSVFAANTEAKIVTEAVPYKHGDVELEGYVAYDDSIEGKRPGVLVVHEWWGLNDYAKKRARMLAEQGYVGFALDMFGKGQVTTDPKQASEWAGHMRGDQKAWLQRSLAGLEVLKNHPLVDTDNLAAIGYCFGGTTAINLALSGEDLDVVASFHGGLPAPTVDEAKAVKGAMLIAHGANDGFIPKEAIEKFRDALNKGGTDYQFVYYANAVHSFTNPGADDYNVKGVAYNEKADERSWSHLQRLLNASFGES